MVNTRVRIQLSCAAKPGSKGSSSTGESCVLVSFLLFFSVAVAITAFWYRPYVQNGPGGCRSSRWKCWLCWGSAVRIGLLSIFKTIHRGMSSCDDKMEYVSECSSDK